MLPQTGAEKRIYPPGICFITDLGLSFICTGNNTECRPGSLKLNGTHHFLAYADDVNILGGSIHTLKENAQALVAATREIGLDVSADRTKYMVMSRDQNAG